MASFCIPKAVSARFKEAIASKEIDPNKLRRVSSEDRLKAFEPIFGPELAKLVNAEFESKLLLKDQKAGLKNWVNKSSNVPEPTRKSMIDQINNLQRVLNPADKNRFLKSLAEEKLGVPVNADEAKEIYDLSMKATEARAALQRSDNLPQSEQLERQMAYGEAKQALTEKLNSLKGENRFDPFTFKSWYDLGSDVIVAGQGNPLEYSYWKTLGKAAEPAGRVALEALGATKAIMSSLDLSAGFVQGSGMISTKQFWQGAWKQFQYFADEKNYTNLNSAIIGHPYYDLALDGGLGITSIEHGKLGVREEAFQSHLVEQFFQHVSDFSKEKFGFGLPNAFRASDRAFTGFLNYVRFYRFVDLVNYAKMSGEEVGLGSQNLKSLAKVVNDFTGRGNLGAGDKYANAGPLLNQVFFSPRKISGNFNVLSGQNFLSASPTARKAALRQTLGMVGFTATMIMLAKVAGGDVNLDPEAQNFGEVKLPGSNTYFDPTLGNRTYIRLLFRLWNNEKVTSGGKTIQYGSGFNSGTRADELLGFMRGKLGPNAAIVANSLYGTDPIGRPFDLSDELSQSLVPMTIGSYIDMANSPHETSLSELVSLSAIFGIGMQPVHFTPSAYGINAWGNPDSLVKDDETKALEEASEQANYQPRLPPKTVNGQKLSKEEYMEYVTLSGQIAKTLLLPQIQSEAWDKATPEERNQNMKDQTKLARDFAATKILAGNSGELLKKSIKDSIDRTIGK